MSFEIEVKSEGLDFLNKGMTGRMRKAVSLGIRNSLALMEKKHKSLFVLGQSKDPQTYPTKLVWRTGALAKSYQIGGIRERSLRGYYGSTLKRAGILEKGGTITPVNAAYLQFRIGDSWIRTKSVKIRGRLMMRQVEKDPKLIKAIEGQMTKAMLKGVDDAG